MECDEDEKERTAQPLTRQAWMMPGFPAGPRNPLRQTVDRVAVRRRA
jgi:hypothetical protein